MKVENTSALGRQVPRFPPSNEQKHDPKGEYLLAVALQGKSKATMSL